MSAWDFFGAPTSARVARSLRAATGALALLGLLHAEGEWRPRLALFAVGLDARAAAAPYAMWSVATIAAVGVMLGRAPRSSALLLCASLAGIHALAPQVYHNNYYVLWLMVAITALDGPELHRGPWDVEEGPPTSALVPRLVQVQVALIYWLSVVAKVAHPWWREGGAVVRWIVTERVPSSGVRGIVNPLLAPALSVPAFAAAAQSGILCLEALLPLMLFSRRWRSTGIVLGAAMHVVMQEWLFPQLFTFLMLLGYFAFVPVGDRGWTVALSDTNGRLARALPRLDWLARVRVVRGGRRGLTLRSPEGRLRTGIVGWVRLATLSPVSVVGYAVLALLAPGVSSICGLPRASLENLVVMVVGGIALIPGKGSSHTPELRGGDGSSDSHPVSAGST